MVVNMQKIEPVTVTLGGMEYDAEAMKQSLSGALFVDGYGLAEQAGSVKAVNVVLLGAALGAGVAAVFRNGNCGSDANADTGTVFWK